MSEVIKRAWVRGVPDTFHLCITDGRPPDVLLAREQHANYVSRLASAGLDVIEVAPDDNHPDCVFIEDTAVLLGPVVVATKPGAPQRVGEVGAVVDALDGLFEFRSIIEPGTLDGGDVMVLGESVFVGRSDRTNQAAIDQLTDLASSVGLQTIPVDVSGVLHLKSAVLPVGSETVVVTPGSVDEAKLGNLRIVYEDTAERNQFSALPLADRVLVTTSAPKTSAALEGLGFEVDPIDVSEILAADGGLTCMSIVEP